MGTTLRRLIPFLLAYLLAACGGGSDNVIGTPPAGGGSNAVQAQGLWTGSFTVTGNPSAVIYAAIAQGGFAFFFSQDGTFYVLSPFTGGSTETGTLTAFAPAGSSLSNGKSQETFAMTETVSSTSIQGKFNGNGETGTFALMPATPLTETPSIVAGNWQGFYLGTGSPAVTITVQPGGVFTGNDADGCTLNGNITQLQSGQNLFGVTLDSTGSTCLGQLKGLAFEGDTDLGGLFGGTTGIYYYIGVSNASGGFVAELKVQ
jgi:hypothetical protein